MFRPHEIQMIHRSRNFRRICLALALVSLVTLLMSCGSSGANPQSTPGSISPLGSATVRAVDLNQPSDPKPIDGPLQIGAAKNEWTSYALQLDHLPANDGRTGLTLRLQPLTLTGGNQTITPDNYSVYQVLPMPVDADKAGYVRHTGLPVGNKQMPRALLPIPVDNGAINVSALRDPANPFDANSRAMGSAVAPLLWVDVHIPTSSKPGVYTSTCDLVTTGQTLAMSQVQVSLNVYDFVIPDERHLLMVSQLDWASLERLYPGSFEAITPRLMTRKDSIYAPAIKTLDQLITLAEKNRVEVVVPRLQPTVKWPPDQLPQIDWSDFDSVVEPWLSGDAFTDKSPLGYWPIPHIDYLDNFDPKSQGDYWASAATHFNQKDWLKNSAVFIDKGSPGRATGMEAIQLNATAARVLASHPLLRVTVPLEDDQLEFASAPGQPGLDPKSAARVMPASTGIVFASPIQSWPDGVERPMHWLRTDEPGLVPYVGAGGDERDVRLWAWLAYLKKTSLILWSGALPRQDHPKEQADPNELVWFYPGSWFGVDEPVPSIQLKWLRRAQQDYEYLKLATDRGMPTNAIMLARLMTKQVQIQPNQDPDPTYALLSGTVDPQTWSDAQSLLARTILLRQPGQSPDDPAVQTAERKLNLDTIRWQEPKERPFVIPRTARWLWDDPTHVVARVGVDIYNAGDNRPDFNQLRWTSAGQGWEFQPQPVVIGALQTYWVQRFNLQARVDLEKIGPTSRDPLTIDFVDGYTHSQFKSTAYLPVAASDRREGHLKIDGQLDDWDVADSIHLGKMVRMLDRPSIQRRQAELSSVPSDLYTSWADENFYIAFKLNGNTSEGNPHRNFPEWQFRRVWGEDICEILIQPIYGDNSLGPVTYIVCKPNGVCWVQRKLDPRLNLDPWAPIENTAVRYADDPDHGCWTGEVAIPWKVLSDSAHGTPKLLRFNFSQHLASNGESASWAGPVDFGGDDTFMGLLYLREPVTPGMKDTHAGN